MNILEQIKQEVYNNKVEIINSLQQLVSINSEPSAPLPNKPFGEGVNQAFHYMLEKATNDGFATTNVDNYGGHIELKSKNATETFGILSHLDVVPAGNTGWDFAPYDAVIKDNKIYGRGTADDKGPTIAAYYAMKVIKKLNLPLKNNIRLILGLDEETNWHGIEYYLKNEQTPDFGFTPDADFPVVCGEKGILVFEFAKKFSKSTSGNLELRSITGGNASNMVAAQAKAVVKSNNTEIYDVLKTRIKGYVTNTGHKLTCQKVGKSFSITAHGKSAHGAKPHDGTNAISILMDFLGNLEFANEGMNEFIDFYNTYINFELDGKSLNINFNDDISGDTVVNVGTIELDNSSVRLAINVRYPITCNADELYENLSPLLTKYNIGIIKGKHQLPIYIDPSSNFIETLMEVYRDNTDDTASQPQIIGGGTYARAVDNFVAFGGIFPGEPELAHQPNEFINIDSLINMTVIYAQAIYKLCTI